jgi:hypothetical protein
VGLTATSNSLASIIIIIIIFDFSYNFYFAVNRICCNLTDFFARSILLFNFSISKQYPNEGIFIVYTCLYLR